MMDETEQAGSITVHGWWLRMCRYRLWLGASVFFGWALLTGVGWLLPAKYRSETLILVEQQRVPEHYVEPNVAVDLQQRLQGMSEQILSRTRLMAIMQKFNLYHLDQHLGDADGMLDRMRKDINIELVKADGRDRISAFRISYSASTPFVAQQITAELTSLFIEENLRNREQLSADTTAFLETQLDEARKNLDQQEQRLREFKNRYMGQLPEQTASNVQILAGLQNRLQSANEGVRQAEQQRLYLQSLVQQYRALRPQVSSETVKSGSVVAPYELNQKIEKLKSQLADLRAKYTPRHPDIVRLQEEISAAEELRKQAIQGQMNAAEQPNVSNAAELSRSGDLQSMSPVMQVESQLKANEFEIASHRTEIKRIEGEIDSYQQRLNLAPAREQELAAITRDHEQSRTNYDSLLGKKNQSRMATDLERRQQGEQFHMIDPPSLAQKPYFPNRLLFSMGGLGFGAALGLALVVIMELFSPRIYAETELRSVIDAPLLISFPPLLTATEIRRRLRLRILEFTVATVMLVTIPAITLFIYYKG